MTRECSTVRERLSEYLDSRLSPQDRLWIEQHAAACLECREEISQLKNLRSTLNKLPDLQPPEAFYQRVMGKLHEREDAPRRTPVSFVFSYKTLATFAVLAVVLITTREKRKAHYNIQQSASQIGGVAGGKFDELKYAGSASPQLKAANAPLSSVDLASRLDDRRQAAPKQIVSLAGTGTANEIAKKEISPKQKAAKDADKEADTLRDVVALSKTAANGAPAAAPVLAQSEAIGAKRSALQAAAGERGYAAGTPEGYTVHLLKNKQDLDTLITQLCSTGPCDIITPNVDFDHAMLVALTPDAADMKTPVFEPQAPQYFPDRVEVSYTQHPRLAKYGPPGVGFIALKSTSLPVVFKRAN